MAKQFFEIVNGIAFHTPEAAQQAKKEVEGIRYIKEQLDMENPEAVLKVYNQILKEKLFKTTLGYHFMREMQEYLICCATISNEDIRPLDPKAFLTLEKAEGNIVEEERLKDRFQKSMIINIILGMLVVAMMLLMRFSDMPTIINYENKLIDRYEHWEKELEEREKALEKYEEELNIQP